MRILVTGAGGALASDVVAVFADDEVVALDHASLDIADREQVLQVVADVRPDVIVNTAAYTDVDGCELHPDAAFSVNSLGVRNVAQAADHVGAWLCHVSTDYVFRGDATSPYVEWDAPDPLSVYGRSKLGGEAEAGAVGSCTIVRSSWLAGATGPNFVRTILERGREGGVLKVVDDQVGCPTFTPDLAGMIRRLVSERRPGLHHVTNQGSTSWYQLAVEALKLAGFEAVEVSPISTDELDPPRAAPRPRCSILDNAALRLSGTPLLADYHEPLERLVKELAAQ